jgi:hypothetical protein
MSESVAGRSVEEIRALCDAATEGPWVVVPRFPTGVVKVVRSASGADVAHGLWHDQFSNSPDAEFIAAARELVPVLLDRALTAEAERDALRAAVEAEIAHARQNHESADIAPYNLDPDPLDVGEWAPQAEAPTEEQR